jgi:hypothetical protein
MFPSRADLSFHSTAENLETKKKLEAFAVSHVDRSIFASFRDPNPMKQRQKLAAAEFAHRD